MRIARLAGFALVLPALAVSAAAFAADWPQWRGPHRDGHAETTAKITALPTSAKVEWKKEVGFGLDSPVVAGGKVFLLEEKAGKEVVRAFDAADGKDLWSAELGESFKDGQSQQGPRCTISVDGDLLFAQSCRGKLACFTTGGKEVWSTDFVKDFDATFIGEKGKAEGHTRHGNTGAPVVDGEHVIAGVGGKDATYVCFEKKTGTVVWKTALEDIPAYAAPIVADLAGTRQVVAFTTTGVVGIDRAGGKLLWRSSAIKTALGRHVTTPVVVKDIVIVGSFTTGLHGVRVTKTADGLKADNAWSTKDAMPNFSSPVVVGEGGSHLVGVGKALKLFCVEAATGKVAWEKDATLGKDHAGLIVVGDAVLALGDAGELVAFAADAKAFREIGRVRVCEKNWCTPAFVEGKLYVRDGKELRCVKL